MNSTQIKHILIVDDQPENLQVICNVFTKSKLPYKVITSPNGLIALKTIEKIIPDIIITDWEMPEMDGIEFIKELKKNKKTCRIPVIMCTGVMTSSANLETALSAGAVDYIRKPIDEIELIARTKANLYLATTCQSLNKLNEINNNIFSIISHDLKSPIASMQSFIDIFFKKRKGNIEESMEFISKFDLQLSSLYSTLENLFEWAKSKRNNVHFNPQMQAIYPAVFASINLLFDIAEKKKITITNNISKNIYCNYDYALISTVFRNLISNAIKFSNVGGNIVIDASEEGSYVTISVVDYGVGMSQDVSSKIFSSTSYVTSLGTKDERGSGLGLKICRDFVEKHGGEIWVESEEGKGSKFIFTLKK